MTKRTQEIGTFVNRYIKSTVFPNIRTQKV